MRIFREFSESTIRILRERVAYMCTNPMCRRLTIRPDAEGLGVVRSGKAAHICAASPGGPRFDPSMTDVDCRSPKNGLWLCDICARMIDDDENGFSVTVLQKWKADAEAYVRELVTQDTRLRQLRGMLMELLSAMRILNGVPGPGPQFDQTFRDAGNIPLGRRFFETELILFENDFLEQAETIRRIGNELIQYVEPAIAGNKPNSFTNISGWKNQSIRTLMLEIMRFKPEAYVKYLKIESDLVNGRIAEVARNPAWIVTQLAPRFA